MQYKLPPQRVKQFNMCIYRNRLATNRKRRNTSQRSRTIKIFSVIDHISEDHVIIDHRAQIFDDYMASEFYLTTLIDCATAYNYSYMGQGLRIFGKYIRVWILTY